MSHEMSDAEVLSHLTTYEPPPDGFDPLTASHHLLRKHGYPHRPHPEKEPRLHKLWREALGRPHRVIKAELQVDRSIGRHPLRSPQGSFGLSGSWAGAEVSTASLGYAPTEVANTVYGQWIVPTVTPPNPDTGFAVGTWVGLGGDGNNNSNQVVQAGTDARSSSDGSVVYRAWTQWFPYQGSAVTVSNFPVSPGNRVGFLVLTTEPGHAFVSMMNYTTGQATSVGITPPGANSDGSSAEWVIEGNGALLADFYSVLFGQCVGGTKDHEFDLTNAFVDTVISADGATTLANAYIITSSVALVAWDSSGP